MWSSQSLRQHTGSTTHDFRKYAVRQTWQTSSNLTRDTDMNQSEDLRHIFDDGWAAANISQTDLSSNIIFGPPVNNFQQINSSF